MANKKQNQSVCRILASMKTRIRPATADDAPRLARMRWEFRAGAEHHGQPDEAEETFVARCVDWMRARLADDAGAWHVWVAENEGGGEDGDLAGQVWVQLIEKLPNPVVELEKHGNITNVYLQDSLRGSGLGQRLVEAAMQCCRDEGVDSVILWPTPRSRTLYERYGFAVRDDLFEAVVDDGRALGHQQH
jgi:GNAT superfamily N-acetyltransferase